MARAHVSIDDLLKLSQRAHGFTFPPPPRIRVDRQACERQVILLVDQRASMFCGSKRATKSVVAAELAALAAFRVAALGDRVGGIVYSEQGVCEIEPHAPESGVHRLLSEVVRHNNALPADRPCPADQDLHDEALRRTARLAGHNGLIVTISDDSGRSAKTEQLTAELAAHHLMVAMVVYDPDEAAPSGVGHAPPANGEMAGASRRHRFAAGFVAARQQVAEAPLKRILPVLPIRTDVDPLQQLRGLIGRRLRRSAE
jgi:uncharacterized protein (DUF58 family)